MNMKHLLGGVAALALLTSPLPLQTENWIVGTAQAQSAAVSVGIFYDELASEGTWVKHSKYRYVWIPTKVAADWKPYTHGRWVYTERYGWYFASDEPFAWAVYHYGRWAFEPRLGWYWVPGRVWAPAWVSWRRSNDHIGWAPLPPEGDGLSVSISISTYEPPRSHWHFVPVRQFASRDLSVVVVNDNSVYERTEYYGPVTIENNIVINTVININFVRENSDEEVEVVEARVVQDPRDARRADGSAVVVVEGQVGESTAQEAPPAAAEPAEVESPTAEQEVEATADGGSSEAPAGSASQAPAGNESQAPAGNEGQAPADASGDTTQNPQAQPAEEQPAGTTGSGEPAEGAPSTETPPAGEPPVSEPADQPPAAGETPGTDGSDSTKPADQPAASEAEPAKPAEEPAAEAPDAGEASGQPPAAAAPAEAEQPAEQAPNGTEATEQAPTEPDASAAEEQQPKSEQCSEEDKAAGRC